jgi:hypothetical protein
VWILSQCLVKHGHGRTACDKKAIGSQSQHACVEIQRSKVRRIKCVAANRIDEARCKLCSFLSESEKHI